MSGKGKKEQMGKNGKKGKNGGDGESEKKSNDEINKQDAIIDAAYKKERCKGKDKTTIEKLYIIKLDIEKQSILTGVKISRSLKILNKIIKDIIDKKEKKKLSRKKYDGL